MAQEGEIQYNGRSGVLKIPFLALSDKLRREILDLEHSQIHPSKRERIARKPLVRSVCAKIAIAAYLHNDMVPIQKKGRESGVNVEFSYLLHPAWQYGDRLRNLARFSTAAANQPHLWVRLPRHGKYISIHLSQPKGADAKIEVRGLEEDILAFRKNLRGMRFG